MPDHLLCPRMETEVSGRKQPKVMQGGVALGSQRSLLLASCFYQARAAFLGKYKARWEGGARNHCLFRGVPEAGKLQPPQRAVTLAHPGGQNPCTSLLPWTSRPAVTPDEDMATESWSEEGGAPVQTVPMGLGFKRTPEPRRSGAGD